MWEGEEVKEVGRKRSKKEREWGESAISKDAAVMHVRLDKRNSITDLETAVVRRKRDDRQCHLLKQKTLVQAGNQLCCQTVSRWSL